MYSMSIHTDSNTIRNWDRPQVSNQKHIDFSDLGQYQHSSGNTELHTFTFHLHLWHLADPLSRAMCRSTLNSLSMNTGSVGQGLRVPSVSKNSIEEVIQ